MDEFGSFISTNIDFLSRTLNLEKLIPELIRNKFLFDRNLQEYNSLVSISKFQALILYFCFEGQRFVIQ
jgi:hypothetical protein